jgi:hypothetical protein
MVLLSFLYFASMSPQFDGTVRFGDIIQAVIILGGIVGGIGAWRASQQAHAQTFGDFKTSVANMQAKTENEIREMKEQTHKEFEDIKRSLGEMLVMQNRLASGDKRLDDHENRLRDLERRLERQLGSKS